MNEVEWNTDTPMVSVVICFYNEESFLEEAIQSVLSQNYPHWELWLVDDGSCDGSTQLARNYAVAFPDRIFYMEHAYHRNVGPGASRNAAIKKCLGHFVAFLDADDVWLPDKLRSQVEILKAQPAATVILEASLYWNSWKDREKGDTVIQVGANEGIYKPPQLTHFLYPLGSGAAPCLSGVMVQRAVLRRCGFEELFRDLFQLYDEHAFLSKVYLKETILVSHACHHKHRQGAASLRPAVHDSGTYHQVRSYYLYWLRDYLRRQPLRYKSLEKLLRKAQMPYREPLLYKLTVDYPAHVKKILIRLLIRLGILNYSKSW